MYGVDNLCKYNCVCMQNAEWVRKTAKIMYFALEPLIYDKNFPLNIKYVPKCILFIIQKSIVKKKQIKLNIYLLGSFKKKITINI